MARLRYTILGCGSSGGVPRIGGIWGDCDPENPRNRRSRCSLLVERIDEGGTTSVLIDTTPDLRSQLLAAGVTHLDAVAYTHSHADHVHGLDDLRQIVFLTRRRVPVWADADTQGALMSSPMPSSNPTGPAIRRSAISTPSADRSRFRALAARSACNRSR